MTRIATLALLGFLLAGCIPAISSGLTIEDAEPRIAALETQVAELRGLHGLDPTPEPTVTAVPTATATVPPTATQVTPAELGSLRWGVFDICTPYWPDGYANQQALFGRSPSLVHWGQQWMHGGVYNEFGMTHDGHDLLPFWERIQATGATPVFDWMPQDQALSPTNQPALQLADIIQGDHDAYISRWAAAAAAWGHPFYLRLAHEMNGDWYAYSELANGNAPGEFVQMWRHVHGLFQAAGATNVQFLWVPNTYISGYSSHQDVTAGLYPGDAYVDAVGLGGYNRGGSYGSVWRSFEDVFSESYDKVTNEVAPGKPFGFIEVGSHEDPDDPQRKAGWYAGMFDALETRFTRTELLTLFHWDGQSPCGQRAAWGSDLGDVFVDSTPQALAAFQAVIADARFIEAEAPVTVVFTETWTGTNSDPWDSGDWTVTGGDTIQSNRGRLSAGGSSYASNTAVLDAVAAFTDGEVRVSFIPNDTSGENYLGIHLRYTDSNNWYRMEIGPAYSYWKIHKNVSGTRTDIGSAVGMTFTASTLYHVAFRVEGTALKAKVWGDGDPEPGWQVEQTDSSHSGSGDLALLMQTGSDSSTRTVDWDDLTIDNLVSGASVPVFMFHRRQQGIS